MVKKKRTEAEMLAIDEKIRELLLQHKGTNEIAKEVGIYHNRVYMVRKKMLEENSDVIPHRDWAKLEDSKKECMKLYMSGCTVAEISRRTGMSASCIRNTIYDRISITSVDVEEEIRPSKKFDNVSMKIKTEWDDVTLDILVMLVQKSAKKVLAIKRRTVGK